MTALRARTLKLQTRLYNRLMPYYAGGMPTEPDVRVPVERHGEGGAAYAVCPDGLTSDSVVYSFGVGAEISFDLSLIERYGLTVHAFDPTDASAALVAERELPPSFHFHQWAVAERDGPTAFHLSRASSPRYQPGSLLELGTTVGEQRVQAYTVASVMRELGHERIDVIKLDVEGAEYALLEALDPASIDARQIVLELHPHLANLEHHSLMVGRSGWKRTEAAIDRLRSGYDLFDVSERGTEFSFLKR